jgi:hypothetical protein
MSIPTAPTTYADWKAPKGDGAVLLWPEAGGLPRVVERNRTVLARSDVLIAGVPLSELRHRTRVFLGHESDAPMFVTGHQCELHHPGVWVKNAVVHHLAERFGGRAMHLAVDTDQPKHLVLRYPTSREGERPPVAVAITDDPEFKQAAWSGRLSGPSPVHAAGLERSLQTDAGSFGFEPVAGRVLASLRRASLEEGVLPPMLVGALHELDWSLGLRYDAILASPLWDYEGFLLLCCHMISRADEYAAAYNAALADYRFGEQITNPGRPMPDLRVSDEIELPLWFDDLGTGTRTRPAVRRVGDRWAIAVAEGEDFAPDPDGGWDTARELQRRLRRYTRRFSPRALTLTTFARLAFADLFVHGIGGGRYDQVTDRTFVSFFGVEPPAFAVATGTLYFPWASQRTRACVPCVRHEGHHLKHALLGDTKRRHLETIATAPRRSPDRKIAFLRMQHELHELWRDHPDLTGWQSRLDASVRAAAQDDVIFDRELFYAMQPRERLVAWIDRVAREVGR